MNKKLPNSNIPFKDSFKCVENKNVPLLNLESTATFLSAPLVCLLNFQ